MIELNTDVELGRNTKHQMILFIKVPKNYEAEFLNLSENPTVKKTGQMHVRVGKPRKPRSTGPGSQGHHFNGHVQQIANYTGDYFDDCKIEIKRKAVAMGYPYRTNAFGHMVPQSEAEASTDECAILIEAAHQVATFLNITLREE